MPTEPQKDTITCCRCGQSLDKANACALAKTFVIFYYCADCFEIVANEEN